MDAKNSQNIVIRSATSKNTTSNQTPFSEGQRLQAAVREARRSYLSLCERYYASQYSGDGSKMTEEDFRGITRAISPVTLTVLDEVAKLVEEAYRATEEGHESVAENAIAVGDELVEQTVQRVARLKAELGLSKSVK